MPTPIGWFGPSLVVGEWFDPTVSAVAWFDVDQMDPPARDAGPVDVPQIVPFVPPAQFASAGQMAGRARSAPAAMAFRVKVGRFR
jgi:hypothetical protein